MRQARERGLVDEQEIAIVHRIVRSGKFLAGSCLQAVLMKPLARLSINNYESRSPGSTTTTHVILRAWLSTLKSGLLELPFIRYSHADAHDSTYSIAL